MKRWKVSEVEMEDLKGGFNPVFTFAELEDYTLFRGEKITNCGVPNTGLGCSSPKVGPDFCW